jgi:hypothetical protein
MLCCARSTIDPHTDCQHDYSILPPLFWEPEGYLLYQQTYLLPLSVLLVHHNTSYPIGEEGGGGETNGCQADMLLIDLVFLFVLS